MIGRPFFVEGRAVAQGSKRAPVAGVVRESGKGLHAWRRKIATVARAHGWIGSPLASPVAVGLVFVRGRPKSHARAGGKLAPAAPCFPSSTPDVDKLERAVLDALTGVCWRDDAQVVCVRKIKLWGTPSGVHVLVREAVVPVGRADWNGSSLQNLGGFGALTWWPGSDGPCP